MDLKKTLAELCAISGPSGFEQTVSVRVLKHLRQYMDDAYIDHYGNAVGVRLCGKSKAKKVLLDAHLDEIGLMVTGVERGFLRFRAIGGVDPRMLPDQEVTLLTNPPIFGLVGCLPPHIQKPEEFGKSIPISDLWIDVGMDQEQAEELIPIGTPIVFRHQCRELENGYFVSKAMDDRAGLVTLLRTAELLMAKKLDVDLYILASTREETGGSGAAVGAFALHPDCCIAVDVTHGATPDAPKESTFLTGGGPAIGVGPNMTRWMTQRLFDKAEEAKIPYQTEVMSGHTGTNAWQLQITREGIPTSLLSVPLKYMHSPVETLQASDIETTATLLAAFLENLGGEGAWGTC